MAQKFYVNANGSFIGSFDGAAPPAGAHETRTAPEHASQIYDFKTEKWGLVPTPVPEVASKLGLKRAMAEAGRWDQVKAMIESNPDIAEDWSLAIEIRRADPMFAVFVSSGAFTEAEIDATFVRAVEIVA